MVIDLLIYFAVGAILDVFYVIWYGGIANNNIALAMFGSFFVTIVGYTLLYNLILGPAFMINLLAFASGCSAGTWIGMRYKNKLPFLKR
jgi:hypothetical protein